MTESVPKSSAMGSSSIAMLLCGVGLDRSDREVARLMNEQKEMATSMGQMLGEEVLHTMRIANDPQTDIRLLGRHTTVTVDGEAYNLIGQRLKRESPYRNTLMATLTIGMARSGYIPDDASFGHETFAVLSSRLQPGCAETAGNLAARSVHGGPGHRHLTCGPAFPSSQSQTGSRWRTTRQRRWTPRASRRSAN